MKFRGKYIWGFWVFKRKTMGDIWEYMGIYGRYMGIYGRYMGDIWEYMGYRSLM
jgi:hypothetical protein